MFIFKLNISAVEEGVLGEKDVQFVFVLVCGFTIQGCCPEKLSGKENQRVSSTTAYSIDPKPFPVSYKVTFQSKQVSKETLLNQCRDSIAHEYYEYAVSVSSLQLFPFALNGIKVPE